MSKPVVGVDGCRSGWLAVIESAGQLDALIAPDLDTILTTTGAVLIGIDIPIGIPDQGSRSCDLLARKLLGRLRASSVFPAPVRACLKIGDYQELSSLHKSVDGRGLTKQAFHLLPKIRQIDDSLVRMPEVASRVREVHPEVSFTIWNGGRPMRFNKATPEGRREREQLIEREWPGQRERLVQGLRGNRFEVDDLNDACAALWSARRIAAGTARVLPANAERDSRGLLMRIEA